MDCVQGGDVASERLHCEHGDLIADIPRSEQKAQIGVSWIVVRRTKALFFLFLTPLVAAAAAAAAHTFDLIERARASGGTYPETTFAFVVSTGNKYLMVLLLFGTRDRGRTRASKKEKVKKESRMAFSPYMTGDGQDASLRDW